jgi:Anti-sigma-K factor rskA
MAFAIALACAAIALENAAELSRRSAFFRRHLELLNARISHLHSEAADAQRRLAAIGADPLADANVNRVLSAPDVVLVRLTPAADSHASGLLAISRQAGAAILEVAGLSVGSGQTSVMWWLLAEGPAVMAVTFNPAANGRLSLAVRMPPHGARIAGALITLEPERSFGKPDGKIMFKGMLPQPQVLS